MTYKINVIQKHTFLHFIVTGQNTIENILKYFEEIHRECAAQNCFRILIEERLEGSRLSIIDIYRIINNESLKYMGFFKAIAYVDINGNKDSMHFVETVSVNRSLPVVAFPTVANAEEWLIKKSC